MGETLRTRSHAVVLVFYRERVMRSAQLQSPGPIVGRDTPRFTTVLRYALQRLWKSLRSTQYEIISPSSFLSCLPRRWMTRWCRIVSRFSKMALCKKKCAFTYSFGLPQGMQKDRKTHDKQFEVEKRGTDWVSDSIPSQRGMRWGALPISIRVTDDAQLRMAGSTEYMYNRE